VNRSTQLRHGRIPLAAVLVILAGGIAGIAEEKEKPSKIPSEARTGIKEFPTSPICLVRREVYVPSPRPGVSPVVRFQNLGNGLRLREFRYEQGKSDLTEKGMVRFSDDNGRNWTPFVPPDTGSDPLRQNNNSAAVASWAIQFDPASRRTIEMVFQRVFLGEPSDILKRYWKGEKRFYDHMTYRLSPDDGRTWTSQRPMIYEAGAQFAPNDWANPAYLRSNEMYGSYDITLLRNGQVAYPASIRVPYQDDEEDRKACANVPKYTAPVPGYVGGVSCFLGKWNEGKEDYDWTHSKPVFVARRISTMARRSSIASCANCLSFFCSDSTSQSRRQT